MADDASVLNMDDLADPVVDTEKGPPQEEDPNGQPKATIPPAMQPGPEKVLEIDQDGNVTAATTPPPAAPEPLPPDPSAQMVATLAPAPAAPVAPPGEKLHPCGVPHSFVTQKANMSRYLQAWGVDHRAREGLSGITDAETEAYELYRVAAGTHACEMKPFVGALRLIRHGKPIQGPQTVNLNELT